RAVEREARGRRGRRGCRRCQQQQNGQQPTAPRARNPAVCHPPAPPPARPAVVGRGCAVLQAEWKREQGEMTMGIGRLALAAAVLLPATAALAQPTAPDSDMAAVFAAQNRTPDPPGSGPYPALMEVDPALPDHVVYRPADLSALGAGKLGLFVWGNGGCADDGASSRLHLSEIASHGYLVIAPGKWRNGPNAKEPPAPPRAPATDAGLPTPPTSAADLKAALDWALADERCAAMVDPEAVAIGGFSCGGLQALELAGDPRLKT